MLPTEPTSDAARAPSDLLESANSKLAFEEAGTHPSAGRIPLTFLLLVGVAAFLIRLGAVLAMREIDGGPQGAPSNDDVAFNNLAEHVARGDGYVGNGGNPTAFRAPGYPFFLAGVYVATAGPHYPLAYLTFCLLGALACILTYFLARELVSEPCARTAAILHAVYLGHIYFATLFLSENLYVPLQTLGIWLFVRYLKCANVGNLLASGAVLGFATLTRPFALLLLPIFLLVLAADRRRRSVFVPAVALTAVFLAFVLPWTLRNYWAFGRPVLVATNGGSTFYGGNNDRVITEPRYFGYWLPTTELPHRDLIDATPDEVAHDKMEWKLGIDWVRANPGKAALLVPLKIGRMAIGLPDFDAGKWYYALRIIGYVPFFFLFLIGAVRLFRDRCAWSLPWLAVHAALVATLVTTVIFWGSPRFRDANVGLLMIFAALAFHKMPAASGRRC